MLPRISDLTKVWPAAERWQNLHSLMAILELSYFHVVDNFIYKFKIFYGKWLTFDNFIVDLQEEWCSGQMTYTLT